MSKTLGNVIDPLTVADRYGVEALRYVLLRHASPFEDSDLTLELIHEHYTAHLVNGLGNLVARVMTLAEAHVPHPVECADEIGNMEPAFFESVGAFRFNEAMDFIFQKVADADAFMTRQEPFKTIKSTDESAREAALCDIEHLVRQLAGIAAHLTSAMPRTAAAILAAIRENKKPDNLFPRL